MEGGLGGEAFVDDPAPYFVGEGGVAKNLFVNGENGGFVVANLAGDFVLEGAQFGLRFVTSGFVVGELGGDFVVFEAFGIRIDENLVDTVRNPDRDTG